MELTVTQRRIIGIAVGVIGLCLLTSLFFRDRAHHDVSELEPLAINPAINNKAAEGPASFTVHIIGAVNAPGVYCLATSARMQDAILAAGGYASTADTQALNLAAPLYDGLQVIVPYLAAGQPELDSGIQANTTPPLTSAGFTPGQTTYPVPDTPDTKDKPASETSSKSQLQAPAPQTASTQPASAPRMPVSLNRGTQQELETLPEVGPALAERIIAFRMQNGPFRKLEDLLSVQGIGPKTLAQIAPYVTL